MKTRLNLTIEEKVLHRAKDYANKQHKSVSELVEGYLNSLTISSRQNNIIELVENLPTPSVEETADLKELYYKEQGKKYGF
jgi:hypothetical protein